MNTDALEWTQAFALTDEEKHMLTDPEWIYPDLIVRGHIVAIVAEPNGGKTTLMAHVAGEIAKGYRVVYVNADISGSDARQMQDHADDHGYQLLLPDMKAGLSMDDVVAQIERMNQVIADYSGIVFIFDTLKKMTDVINKSKSKQLYKTLRGLSAKGMTVVLLAHTNKYSDADGRPIYEGTGDLRSDIDELIYLLPEKHADGSMTVSTLPDKKRADLHPVTFEVSPDRDVRRAESYIDVAQAKRIAQDRERDLSVIEAILDAIQAGHAKQTEIIRVCAEIAGRRTVERVLRQYAKPPAQEWEMERAFQNNSRIYSLIKHSPICDVQSTK